MSASKFHVEEKTGEKREKDTGSMHNREPRTSPGDLGGISVIRSRRRASIRCVQRASPGRGRATRSCVARLAATSEERTPHQLRAAAKRELIEPTRGLLRLPSRRVFSESSRSPAANLRRALSAHRLAHIVRIRRKREKKKRVL